MKTLTEHDQHAILTELTRQLASIDSSVSITATTESAVDEKEIALAKELDQDPVLFLHRYGQYLSVGAIERFNALDGR